MSGALALSSVAAHATTLDFTVMDNSTVEATGSFSYTGSPTTLMSYSDLTAFSLTIKNTTFDLPFVESVDNQVFNYFDFDTVTDSFVPKLVSDPTAGFSVNELFGAVEGAPLIFGSGFIFQNSPQEFSDNGANVFDQPYTAVDVTPSDPVPEPGSLILFGSALFGFAVIGIRRQATRLSLSS